MNMSKKNCCKSNKADISDQNTQVGVSVNVLVDVPKIVKYMCIAAITIIGIIFGTRCYHKMIENGILKPME